MNDPKKDHVCSSDLFPPSGVAAGGLPGEKQLAVPAEAAGPGNRSIMELIIENPDIWAWACESPDAGGNV